MPAGIVQATVPAAQPRPCAGDAPAARRFRLRQATPSDVEALFGLISAQVETGRLLPRSRDELALHVARFTVAVETPDEEAVIGGVELAPLGRDLAEVRSLVVADHRQGTGIGTALVRNVHERARRAGYGTLCAFTHEPRPFLRLGFSTVPHAWLPEKIAVDCQACALYGRCGRTAVRCRLR
jgi:amino-acid N-acetyltransferase